MKRFLRKYAVVIVVCVCVAVAYGLMFAVDITCPIKYLTGISCAGCGMSRACFSVLQLDFSAAFYYHPLWFLLPISALLSLIFYVKRKKRLLWATIAVTLALFLGVYLYRLLALGGDVVVFAPEEGVIFKHFFR